MSRTKVTPPINISGNFTANAPYTLDDTLTYQCTAIRSFKELAQKRIDVYKEYYKPKLLSETIYTEDARQAASIITLLASNGTVLYVPNTYLSSYPGMSGSSYSNRVILLSLGMLRDDVNIDYVLEDLEDVIRDNVGVEAEAKISNVPVDVALTEAEGNQLEATRAATIAANETLTAKVARLQAKVDELMRVNLEYEKIIKG